MVSSERNVFRYGFSRHEITIRTSEISVVWWFFGLLSDSYRCVLISTDRLGDSRFLGRFQGNFSIRGIIPSVGLAPVSSRL